MTNLKLMVIVVATVCGSLRDPHLPPLWSAALDRALAARGGVTVRIDPAPAAMAVAERPAYVGATD